MSNLQSFSPTTIEKLKYYVYALVNPIDNKIFYIGKGQGNRVFHHQNDVLKDLSNEDFISLKIETIKNIVDQNKQVISYVVRHGLEENYAHELEATLIDILSFNPFSLASLTNVVSGHNTSETGVSLSSEIECQYSAPIITSKDFQHNVLIISANRFYDPTLSPIALYNVVRKAWSVNIKRAEAVDYVIIKYQGVLKEIYKVDKWVKYSVSEKTGKPKYAFEGDIITDSNIRELYLNKKLELDKKSYGMPFNYIENKNISTEGE